LELFKSLLGSLKRRLSKHSNGAARLHVIMSSALTAAENGTKEFSRGMNSYSAHVNDVYHTDDEDCDRDWGRMRDANAIVKLLQEHGAQQKQ
jgi:hypothetical protein